MSRAQFERLMKLWFSAGKIPALVFLGDKNQLPGMDDERVWHSPAWLKECKHVTLQKLYRCKDKAYAEILKTLRLHKPKKALINRLCRYDKAWNTKEPTVDDIKKLYHEKPETMIFTFNERGERLDH